MKRKRMIIAGILCGLLVLLCGCGGVSTGEYHHGTEATVETKALETKALVTDADKKYVNCNNKNLYVQAADGTGRIRQYTLDGYETQTFMLPDDLSMLYVNDEEMIVQEWKEDEPSVLYSIPITQSESGDVLDVENIVEITKTGAEEDGEVSVHNDGDLYADQNYLVYISDCHELYVYDRINKKFIELQNAPKANYEFSNVYTSILACSDGEYVVFNTKPFQGDGEDVSYGFSVYHLGDDHITIIDEKCETTAPRLFWDEKQAVIYAYGSEYNEETEGDDVWIYDCQTRQKKILISSEEIRGFLDQYPYEDGGFAKGIISEMYVDGSILYMGIYGSGDTLFLRYDLDDGGKLSMESELNGFLKKINDSDFVYRIAFTEGKCLIEWDDSDRYSCFDLKTGQNKPVITSEDMESFYCRCLGWLQDE